MLLDSRKLSEPAAAASPAEELVDSITGEVLDLKDADVLISAFERVSAEAGKLWDLKRKIAQAIASLTEGEAKTRRLRGRTRAAKVEMPDEAGPRGS